jgi:TPR repeat protein
LYYIGDIVEQDFSKGASYFLQAAHSGTAIAQYNVGVTYYTGQGAEAIDYIKSYAWMNIAASNGHHPAIGARDYLQTLLSREELNKAQRLSLELGVFRGKHP